MDKQRSPGPWTVFDPETPGETFGIDDANGEAVVFYGTNGNDGIPSKDDARLIAAAPELLEALIAIRPYLNAGEALLADAAIAKATASTTDAGVVG